MAARSSNFKPLPSPRSFRLLKLLKYKLATPENNAIEIGMQSSFLGFTLENFTLDDSPEYHALSYTWGEALHSTIEHRKDEEPSSSSQRSVKVPLTNLDTSEDGVPGSMLLNGKSYMITQNLEDALEQLADSGLVGEWVWIDAICIDQDNLEEKGVQVALMGDIYSKAKDVIVWLGSKTTDLEDFMWLNDDFLVGIEKYVKQFGMEDLMQQTPFSPKLLGFMDMQPPCGDWLLCWENYMSFCRRRRWFSRIWIVQEVALARKVIVQCGPHLIPWEYIEILGGLLRTLGWQTIVAPSAKKAFGRAIGDEVIRLSVVKDRLQSITVQDPTPIEESILGLSISSGASSPCSPEAEERFWGYLQGLLYDTRPYSATDPRDKIFGILGIAQKALPRGMAMLVEPDYTKDSTTQNVYTSIASVLLEKVPRLANLSYVEDKASRRLRDLPSWVPDYTTTLTPNTLVSLRDKNFSFDCCPYSILPEAKHNIYGGRLEVRGAMLDRVAETCLPMWDAVKFSDMEPLLKLCIHVKVPYLNTNHDVGEVLWRTMIADTYQKKPAATTMTPIFKVWLGAQLAIKVTPDILVRGETGQITTNLHLDEPLLITQLRTLQNVHDSKNSGDSSMPTVEEVLVSARQMHRFKLQNFIAQHATLDPNDPFPTMAEQTNLIHGRAAAFHSALGPTIPFRRLYLTQKGYLGLGPESTEVGDQIWMLQGGQVPFVLRGKADQSFELMGETYLHGFMDGKMAEELKDRVGPVHIT